MIRIITMFGVLYIESPQERAEDDRIKLYDSRRKYLDYFPVPDGASAEEVTTHTEHLIEDIKNIGSVDSLVASMGNANFKTSEHWEDLLKDMYGDDAEFINGKWIDLADGSEITESIVMGNDFVNKVGPTYIFIME